MAKICCKMIQIANLHYNLETIHEKIAQKTVSFSLSLSHTQYADKLYKKDNYFTFLI